MRRWSLVALATLACTPDTERLGAAPADGASSATSAVSATADVRGDAGGILYGGDRPRRVRFQAQGAPEGAPAGWVEMQLERAAPAGSAGAPAPLRFEVTCLAVDGNRAWIGVRLPGPGSSPDARGDVWYVEDGGRGGVDRAGVWIGLAPEACRTRPTITWALPLTHGDLVISAE